MKNILYTLLCILTLFIPTSFAQQNLQEVNWTSGATLPALGSDEDGYYIHGDLALGESNYFIAGAREPEDVRNYYVKLGNFGNSDSNTNLYVGENGTASSPSYYGDITVDVAGEFTIRTFSAGSYARANTSYGDIKTTISGDVNVTRMTYSGGYVNGNSVVLTQKSTALNITNGKFVHNIFVGGVAQNGGKSIITNGSSLSITKADISGETSIMIAAGVNTVANSSSVIEGGTSVYVGSGAIIDGGYYVMGGGESYGVGSSSKITGGTSVIIDGATIGTASKKSYILGGSHSSGNGKTVNATSTVDNTSVTILSGTINGEVYGGSITQMDGATVITGDTLVEIKGGTLSGGIFGGSLIETNGRYVNGKNTVIEGSTNVKITGGSFTGNVFGGSNADSEAKNYGVNGKIIGGTNVEISDGTITGNVYGGSRLSVKAVKYNSSTTDGDVNINISGGNITGNVVAGSYTKEVSSQGKEFGATVSSAKVVVSGGTIGGNIIASGEGADSIIEGNSEIVFIGNGADIKFEGNVSGAYENSQVLGETLVSFGEGEKAFTGTFNGSIENIDRVLVAANSDVTFTKGFKVSNLVVEGGAKVNITEDTSFGILTIAFGEEFGESSTFGFDMSEMFGDSTSIVLSKIERANSFTVQNSDGTKFEASYSDGAIEVGSVYVPEPSTYAAIFGALALAFVAYRRRK